MAADDTRPTLVAPAPWQLQGRGYITMLRFDAGDPQQNRFLPASLAGRRAPSRLAWMMFVDYATSDVGPYHELLYIPGSFPFEDGQRHLSISRIFVSSQASVDNGRRNWGIPKDVAQFDVRYGEQGLDRVRVSRHGKVFAELDYRAMPLSLPFSTALVPKAWRTLGQHHDGRMYRYTPSASGWIQPARLQRCQIDASEFPDVSRARPVLSVAVPRFRMGFPVSAELPLPA